MIVFKEKHNNLLQEIYYATKSGGFITFDELQNSLGLSIHEMQPFLEDLKENIFIVQAQEGFQIAPEGSHYAQSKWV